MRRSILGDYMLEDSKKLLLETAVNDVLITIA